jgi:hypothetical protein
MIVLAPNQTGLLLVTHIMLNRVLSTQRKGALVLNAVDTEESKTKPKME